MAFKHTLDKPWSIDGDWINTSDPKGHRVPGDLVYDPEDNSIHLKLRGIFGAQQQKFPKQLPHPRVVGTIPGVGPCTLLDTFTNGMTAGGAAVRTTLIAHLAIVGLRLTQAKHVKFAESSVDLGHLEEWLGWRPIDFDVKSLSMTYTKPADIVAHVPSLGATLSITSEIRTESESWQHQTMIHSARVEIVSDKGQRTLEWHLDVGAALRDLVTLLIGSPSWFRTIRVKKGPREIGYVAGVRTVTPRKYERFRDPELSLGAVQLSFTDLATRWFDHRLRHESSHHLLFGTFYDEMPYSEFKFLASAQALESYVKAPMSTGVAKSTTFVQCVGSVLAKFSPGMQRRLVRNVKAFAEKIRYTRNYLTHYSKHMLPNAYRGMDIYYAAQRLRLLLVLSFLLDLGIEEKVLRDRMLTAHGIEFDLKRWRG